MKNRAGVDYPIEKTIIATPIRLQLFTTYRTGIPYLNLHYKKQTIYLKIFFLEYSFFCFYFEIQSTLRIAVISYFFSLLTLKYKALYKT